MRIIISLIIAISGFIIGGVIGVISSGYLIIFKSFDWMGSASNLSEWVKVGEGIIILLFTKFAIMAGGVIGGFFGSIPGILMCTKFMEDEEE